MGPEHFLLGLIEEGDGRAAIALRALDVLLEDVQLRVREEIGLGVSQADLQVPLSPRVRALLQRATAGARRLGHSRVGTAHVLLALAVDTGGIANRLFYEYRLDVPRLHEVIARRASTSSENEGPPSWEDLTSQEVLYAFVDPEEIQEPIRVGWRARTVGLAALGAAALTRRAFDRGSGVVGSPLALQVLVRLYVGPADGPLEDRGELADSARIGLGCEAEELKDVVTTLADARLILVKDEQDEDQRLLITEAGAAHVEQWLIEVKPLFHDWPPNHPCADDAVG